ncbi:lipopolysaccharide biosynthesis protein [Extensimonas vulgaris]|uniref:O-antigen/teichoic acid export membrane protein n=1 Tax=Extensimonas vulgaris TaxID=1031594 RepID=A0A369ATR0_9BURK|nr:oligosaccharide flippase family protein [Extensimonas vulgaris]RCX11646.1 O-antigen/teichoic acid export membrane protein [Extensimonas vulgaris]TWI40541.1 O-antigen/teichoic acid export membrane protein [Extensimonas vulgaris]TXD16556.1 oligosaccharide flippase family protein [Extensimonas vulgaris]
MGKPQILGGLRAGAGPTRAPTLASATLTLLAGGALAQLVPLLLGPVLARLFTPQAMGVFTQFSTVAASLAVAASLRYEQALPLAVADAPAQALLALALRLLAVAVVLSIPLAWLLHAGGWLPLPHWLPLAVGTAGLLQVLMLWANRAQRFGALAASRVLNYAGAAALQVGLGLWLWQGAASGAQAAWALVLAPLAAQLLASLWLLQPAPAGGWRSVLGRADPALRAHMRAVARQYRDFAWVNTPHAFLGTLQDALAVALLIAWSGDAAAGLWGLALRYLKAPATLVGSAVSQALYPRLAVASPAQARRSVRQVMVLLALPALVLMAVLLLAGPWLFAWVFGAPWREAGEVARALAPYIAAHFVAAPLAVVTMAWQAQRWAFRLALVGQAAFVLALALGLHWGGLRAGAWAVSAVMVPYFGWYFWRLARWRDIPMLAGHAAEAAP